jgi:predicted ester cyclase
MTPEDNKRVVRRGVYDGLPPTGKTIIGRAISIYRLRDGQIVAARGIWDQAEVWQQLGLIPETSTIWRPKPE